MAATPSSARMGASDPARLVKETICCIKAPDNIHDAYYSIFFHPLH